jgi:hypothetical protein
VEIHPEDILPAVRPWRKPDQNVERLDWLLLQLPQNFLERKK